MTRNLPTVGLGYGQFGAGLPLPARFGIKA